MKKIKAITASELLKKEFHDWVPDNGYAVTCSKCKLHVMVPFYEVRDRRFSKQTVKRSITDILDEKYFNCGKEWDI